MKAEGEPEATETATDAAAVHPASAEAGSWTRSMVLLSNLRGRLQAVGRRNYDHYAGRVTDAVRLLAYSIQLRQACYKFCLTGVVYLLSLD